jgi:UDP-N-acetylmuramoyl-tripeptide--D-alanyl-D-alanine ligase
MIELGALQDQENYKLGLLAAQHATDVILIGRDQTHSIHKALQSQRFDMGRVRVFATLAEAVSWYPRHLSKGDTVLFLNDLPDTY